MYEKSATKGSADAQFRIGVLYVFGKGVRQDYAKANQWFEKAANQGHADAQVFLGAAYLEGRGVRQNRSTAKEWFGRACDKGDQMGCNEYRKLNEQGY